MRILQSILFATDFLPSSEAAIRGGLCPVENSGRGVTTLSLDLTLHGPVLSPIFNQA